MKRCYFTFVLFLATAVGVSAASLDEYEIEFSELSDCMDTILVGTYHGLKMEFEVDRDYYSKANQDLYYMNILSLVADFPLRMKEFDAREAEYYAEKWREDRPMLNELVLISLNELDGKIRECNRKYF